MANNFSGDANCKAVFRFESGALTREEISNNNTFLTDVNSVMEDTTNFEEGACSADFESTSTQGFYVTDANLPSGFPFKNGDATKKISVCGFFKPESLISGGHIIAKMDSGKQSFRIVMFFSSPNYKLALSIGYGGGLSWEDILHGSALTAGRRYHFGCTFDDSDKSYKLRIWDITGGALLGSDLTGTSTNNINVEDGNLGVGCRRISGTISQTWDGLLDELVIFNDILTIDEIDSIRQQTYGASSSSLLPIFGNQNTQKRLTSNNTLLRR